MFATRFMSLQFKLSLPKQISSRCGPNEFPTKWRHCISVQALLNNIRLFFPFSPLCRQKRQQQKVKQVLSKWKPTNKRINVATKPCQNHVCRTNAFSLDEYHLQTPLNYLPFFWHLSFSLIFSFLLGILQVWNIIRWLSGCSNIEWLFRMEIFSDSWPSMLNCIVFFWAPSWQTDIVK